jgi:hypothetical protein
MIDIYRALPMALCLSAPLFISEAEAAPQPPPPIELDTSREGDSLESPIEGAFWIPLASGVESLFYQDLPGPNGEITTEDLTVRVSSAEGEIEGSLYLVQSSSPERFVYWRASEPLSEGVYEVNMVAEDVDNYEELRTELNLSLNVSASSQMPETSASLSLDQVVEFESDDEVVCCNTMDPNECSLDRFCDTHCWAESYRYDPRFMGTFEATATDRYEAFTLFRSVVTLAEARRGSYYNIFGDQLADSNELSELQNVELEAGDELCYSIAWENLITGDSGSSAPVCFTQEQVEVIEHRVPSNESLNEEAAMCFALPEGYPKESGDDPNTEADRAVSNDDGCQQRSGSPWGLGLWLCALALWIRRRALRLA